MRFRWAWFALFVALLSPAHAQSLSSAIDAAIQPYVAQHQFAGAVLVARDGGIVFDKAYGDANVEAGLPNTISTSFHIGPLSMAYTAAVVMHLEEKGALSLDNTVAQFLPDVPNGDRMTIRGLLESDPVASDTPEAYRLLARVVEQRSGTSFGEALNAFLFAPYWMDGAGIDEGDLAPDRRYALGYVRDDAGLLKPAEAFSWSAERGKASLYATTRDELRFVDLVFGDDLLKPETRAIMFDARPGFGYGWVRNSEPALGGRFCVMTGRVAGFSAFVLHAPAANATVIVLANIEAAESADMGRAIAALALAEP